MTRDLDTRRPRGRPPGPGVDAAVRREELLDAAEQVIARTGPSVSFSDIAVEAGFARTAVYAMYPDQRALVHALAVRHTERITMQANIILDQHRPVRELLAELIDLFCSFVEANPKLHPLLMQDWYSDDATGSQRPMFNRSADWATTVLETIMRSTDVVLPVGAARAWACATVGAMLMAAEDWSTTGSIGRAQLVEQLTAFIWPAIASVGGEQVSGPIVPHSRA
ncbi:TetR/AcrR family transcriptional regulator [Antrihabitans spumae]|uniref:TetR/AcrR family transcriptional regulator n=1 Tax=Antrihabitans spumae TaxID=3373370 RepID=A0ABW7KCZ9_9NOCA